ncbi:hypothetical protein QUC31_011467 [Theobroma cacao]
MNAGFPVLGSLPLIDVMNIRLPLKLDEDRLQYTAHGSVYRSLSVFLLLPAEFIKINEIVVGFVWLLLQS